MKLDRGARVVKAGKLLPLAQEQGDRGFQSGRSGGTRAKWCDWWMDECGCKDAEESGRTEVLNVSV